MKTDPARGLDSSVKGLDDSDCVRDCLIEVCGKGLSHRVRG